MIKWFSVVLNLVRTSPSRVQLAPSQATQVLVVRALTTGDNCQEQSERRDAGIAPFWLIKTFELLTRQAV